MNSDRFIVIIKVQNETKACQVDQLKGYGLNNAENKTKHNQAK